LLAEARRIIAARGYVKASTRDIATAAGTQVGLIAYHFGDKAGLYRTLLEEPLAAMIDALPRPDDATPMEDWLYQYYRVNLESLFSEEGAPREIMRIFGREISERSEVFEKAYADFLIPQHLLLTEMLAKRVGASSVDSGVQQLAMALTALAHDYWVSADHLEALAPGLLRERSSLEPLLRRLVSYGLALVACERSLRQRL
jgi:AcrR family transcriptional regulator